MRDIDLEIGPITERPLKSARSLRRGPYCSPTINRRQILAGALAIGAQTIAAPATASSSSEQPTLEIDDQSLSVTFGQQTWEIRKSLFDGGAKVDFARNSVGCVAKVRGGTFRLTNLPASLECKVYQKTAGQWRFQLSIPALGIDGDTDLSSWLAGATLPGTEATDVEFANRSLTHSTCFSAESNGIDSSWSVYFRGCHDTLIGKRRFNAASVTLRFGPRNSFSNTELTLKQAVPADPPRWILDETFSVGSDITQPLAIKVIAFDKHETALAVEPQDENGFVVYRAKTKLQARVWLEIENYRFIEYAVGAKTSQRFMGDISERAGALMGDGYSYELKGTGASSLFALHIESQKLVRLDCAPRATAAQLLVEGATTSLARLTQGQNIRFLGTHDDLVSTLKGEFPSVAEVSTATGIDQLSTINPVPHVVCATCDADGKPDNLTFYSTHICRSEDLLSLGFEFYNFELAKITSGKQTKRVLQPLEVPGPSLVIVHFDPQHIQEESYNDDIGCAPAPRRIQFPVVAKLSGPTRLVFEYPKDNGPLDLSLDALLDWSNWKVQKVPDARHTRLIEEPTWHETAIELPSRIVSQPADGNHFRAKKIEPQSTSSSSKERRYSLFHAELLPDEQFDPLESDGLRRPRFVPIWTSDFVGQGITWPETPPVKNDFLPLVLRRLGLKPIDFSKCTVDPNLDRIDRNPNVPDGVSVQLAAQDRQEIVKLSHDSTLCPRPPKANHFILSARGGFSRVEGYWPATRAALAANINLERWNEDISEGQTQKEEIQRRGFLFPFGHRAIYTRDTNRRIHAQDGAYYAPLKTTYFLKIRQPRIEYQQHALGDVFTDDRTYQMPFRSLEIQEKVTPFLDQPIFLDGEFDQGRLDVFWPQRCKELLNLTFIGTDWVGNQVKFVAPVIFVGDTALGTDVAKLSEIYQKVVPSATQGGPNRRDFAGQTVALAPGYQKNDTEIIAQSVDFSAVPQVAPFGVCDRNSEPPHEYAPLCEVLAPDEKGLSAPFYPVVSAIETQLPVLARASGTGGGTVWMEITNPSISENEFEVFAVKHPDFREDAKFSLEFHKEADRSGGVAAPTPKINAISRLRGPIGAKEDFVASLSTASRTPSRVKIATLNTVDPRSFFKFDAKICGVISVSEILSEIGIDTSPSLLNFLTIGGDTPDTTGFVYDWDTDKIKSWPSSSTVGFQFKTGLDDNEGSSTSRLTIRGGVQIEILDDAKPIGFVEGSLSNFRLRLVFAGNGIEAPFTSIRFYAPIGAKTKFDVSIGDVRFLGPIMEFATALKEFLGLGDGYDLSITPKSLTASIGPVALPAISFGVFSLSNISFSVGCALFFDGSKPLAFWFSFASQSSPFTLAVAFLAGRGYFLFEVNTKGLQRIEASLEFGAYAEIAFGSVARGYLYVMGGVFYSSKKTPHTEPALDENGNQLVDENGNPLTTVVDQLQIEVEIYVRFGGALSALGFITISIDVHLGLKVVKRASQTYAEGSATLSYSVKIGFFKKSFSVTYSKALAGSQSNEDARRLIAPAAMAAKEGCELPSGKCATSVGCVDAIGIEGFRALWYSYGSAMAA